MSTRDTTAVTIEQIEAAIVAALAPTGVEAVMWARLRVHLPGTLWSRETALLHLDERGEVRLRKFERALFVSLGTDADREASRRARATGRVLRARTVA